MADDTSSSKSQRTQQRRMARGAFFSTYTNGQANNNWAFVSAQLSSQSSPMMSSPSPSPLSPLSLHSSSSSAAASSPRSATLSPSPPSRPSLPLPRPLSSLWTTSTSVKAALSSSNSNSQPLLPPAPTPDSRASVPRRSKLIDARTRQEQFDAWYAVTLAEYESRFDPVSHDQGNRCNNTKRPISQSSSYSTPPSSLSYSTHNTTATASLHAPIISPASSSSASQQLRSAGGSIIAPPAKRDETKNDETFALLSQEYELHKAKWQAASPDFVDRPDDPNVAQSMVDRIVSTGVIPPACPLVAGNNCARCRTGIIRILQSIVMHTTAPADESVRAPVAAKKKATPNLRNSESVTNAFEIFLPRTCLTHLNFGERESPLGLVLENAEWYCRDHLASILVTLLKPQWCTSLEYVLDGKMVQMVELEDKAALVTQYWETLTGALYPLYLTVLASLDSSYGNVLHVIAANIVQADNDIENEKRTDLLMRHIERFKLMLLQGADPTVRNVYDKSAFQISPRCWSIWSFVCKELVRQLRQQCPCILPVFIPIILDYVCHPVPEWARRYS